MALYIILDVVAPLVATFNLSAQFLFTGTLFIYLYFQIIGIVQCFVLLGFLSLLENFGLVTPIPVGIRVLGVNVSNNSLGLLYGHGILIIYDNLLL